MKRFQLFIRGLSTNWIGTLGIVLTTTAFLLFVFFELLQLAGILTNAYLGLMTYLALPVLFLLGLVLIPIGWWRYRRAAGRPTSELLTQRFPDDMTRAKRLGSSLVATVALLTLVNVTFLGVASARMLHFMDQPEFCGTACHSVMEPEWVAYQNSPHANVRCVDCHVGEGAGALFDSKLNGLWQMVSATFDLHERPIPTPVHQLRPAQETCEKCHWPDKFYGQRIKTVEKFALDEGATSTYSTLALKVGSGSGEERGTIHWHIAEANEVRYQSADDTRAQMEWVEVGRDDGFHRYTSKRPAPPGAGERSTEGPRSMDCVDCHNRATHIYQDPEEAVDAALAAGRIDRSLPFAKKVSLEALLRGYGNTKEAALAGIETGVRGFYMRDPAGVVGKTAEVDHAIEELKEIYRRNIFPTMEVGWNTYSSNLGHKNGGGCFRCHNADMVDDEGRSVPYDCTLCHSILARDSGQQFQFLLPLDEKDPDRKMHAFLREEFLGLPGSR